MKPLSYQDGYAAAHRAARLRSIAAIRRAVEYARDWEAFGGDHEPIRYAIRRAIGSGKA